MSSRVPAALTLAGGLGRYADHHHLTAEVTVDSDAIDEAATRLRAILEDLLETLDAREQRMAAEARTKAPACASTELDFISYEGRLITAKLTRKHPEYFRRHLAICDGCGFRDQCDELAERDREVYGIWAGVLPHERLKARRRRTQ